MYYVQWQTYDDFSKLFVAIYNFIFEFSRQIYLINPLTLFCIIHKSVEARWQGFGGFDVQPSHVDNILQTGHRIVEDGVTVGQHQLTPRLPNISWKIPFMVELLQMRHPDVLEIGRNAHFNKIVGDHIG